MVPVTINGLDQVYLVDVEPIVVAIEDMREEMNVLRRYSMRN